ncbi:MAG: putative RND superfamily exporter protein [Cyclobacteriaceae bacterium]|jgi:predicted RND superfamily exporter protein
MKSLQPEFEFEKLFPKNDADIEFYESHIDHFGYDNDFLLLIIESEPVFESHFLTRVKALGDSIRDLNGIINLISPMEMSQLIDGPMGLMAVPIIHPEDPGKLKSDSTRIFNHPLYSGFFGQDGKSLVLQISHEHFTTPEAGDLFLANLNKTINQFSFAKNRLIGKLTAQTEFINLIQKDFVLFIIVALLISFLLLAGLLRSIKSALLPYLISLTSLIWLLGFMAFSGEKINILGSLIPPIILFVATSDAIHLMNAYRKSKNDSNSERMLLSIKKVLVPTILTSVTTSIGFFSLISITTEPVQMLGIFTGIGVIIAFVVTFIFGPLLIFGWKPTETKSINFKPFTIFILRNQKSVLIITSLIIIASIVGIFKLETNALLLDDLPESSIVKQNFQYAENQYFGYKPWEIAYWQKNGQGTIWDESVMTEANKIHHYLTELYTVGRIWSPVDMMKYGNQMTHGGDVRQYQFPASNEYEEVFQALRPIVHADSSIQNTVSRHQDYARIIGFIPEYGSRETILRNQKLLTFLSKNIDNSIIGYRITGTTYLIDKSHDLLTKNLIIGLFIALILVSLVLGIYFKSVKIMIISLIPNLIPLIITAGFMGFAGIPLKLTTSIIFAVSFGIAVDDTIHFISVYRLQRTPNTVFALLRTFQSAGNAIIITSIIILAGFGIFLFSSFGATYFLGLFLCISLSSAMIIDLTLLPIILNNWNKKR